MIACNVNYLIEALKSLEMEEKTIKTRMTLPTNPIMLTNNDKDMELIMPVRLVH